MGPIWGRQDPGGPYVGLMNLAIRDIKGHGTDQIQSHRVKIMVYFVNTNPKCSEVKLFSAQYHYEYLPNLIMPFVPSHGAYSPYQNLNDHQVDDIRERHKLAFRMILNCIASF